MAKETPEYTITKYRVEGSSYSSGGSNRELEYRRLYKHLNERSREIRLLSLEPAADSQATIRCSLIRTTVDSGMKFEALSYAWGDPGQDRWIVVDGLEVPVRPKLWEALIHLRDRHRIRILWIDALSIDQNNILEKNHQVMKMSQIYSAATTVIVWLGVESADSTQTLQFITFVSQHRRKYGEDPDIVYDKHVGSMLEGVRKLCQRMYWKRLWIIQEVSMAKEVWIQCGMERIPWDDLLVFLSISSEPDKFSTFTFNTATGGRINVSIRSSFHKSTLSSISLQTAALVIERIGQAQSRRFPLYRLLHTYSASLCSNIKDGIYGVFGLSCDATDLTVDYSKSNFDIFIELIKLQRYNPISHAVSLISFSNCLHRHTFRGRIQIAEQAYKEQVSTATVGILTGAIRYMGPLHRFIQSTKAIFQEPAVEELLHFADRDGELSIELLASHESLRLISQEVCSIYSEISYGVSGGVDMFDQKFLHDAFALGLLVDEYKYMEKECILAGNSWGRPAQLPRSARQTKTLDPEQLLEYEGAEPQFFADDEGRIGLAPSNTCEGDIICQFHNSDILAILRWQHDRYVFVGRAIYPFKDGVCFYPELDKQYSQTLSIHMNYHTLSILTR